jgi:hypothetical protein
MLSPMPSFVQVKLANAVQEKVEARLAAADLQSALAAAQADLKAKDEILATSHRGSHHQHTLGGGPHHHGHPNSMPVGAGGSGRAGVQGRSTGGHTTVVVVGTRQSLCNCSLGQPFVAM